MADLFLLGQEKAKHHKFVYDSYSQKLLDYILTLVATSLFMTYTLYCVFGPIENGGDSSIGANTHEFLIYTTPVALFLIIRYLYLVHAKPKMIRHTENLIKDLPFFLGVLLLSLLMLCFLYISSSKDLWFF